jgi:hypothetical protein
MNKKAVLPWIIALILLMACGGGDAEPAAPAANDDSSSPPAAEVEGSAEVEEAVAPVEEAPAEESVEAGEDASEEAATEEVMEEVVEEAPASPFGDRPMSGTDPETGLLINPDSVRPGDTFIVRGEIISMNLTPITAPEFLILSPDGLRFRLRSQSLNDTFYEDGEQLQPFQYRNGMLAQATATLAANATSSDIPTSTDLVLVKSE